MMYVKKNMENFTHTNTIGSFLLLLKRPHKRKPNAQKAEEGAESELHNIPKKLQRRTKIKVDKRI